MKKIYIIMVALLILSSSIVIADHDDDKYENHDDGRHSSHDDDNGDSESWDVSNDFVITEPVKVVKSVVVEEPVVESVVKPVEPVFVSNYTEPVYSNNTNITNASVFNENLSKLDDLYANVDSYLTNNSIDTNLDNYDDYLKQKDIDLKNKTIIVNNTNEKRENVFVSFFTRLFSYLGLMR